MSFFMHQGEKVIIPRAAEVSHEFRPNGKYADAIQAGIDGIKELLVIDITVATIESNSMLNERILENAGRHPQWGIHAFHTARYPEPSPFLSSTTIPRTNAITIEMTATEDSPLLVRAYPGEYRPPLPWQRTVHLGIGGYTASVEFWRSHSFLYFPRLVRGELSDDPPRWYH